MTAILYYLSILLGALGSLMLPTALVALSAGDVELAEGFLLTSGLTGFLSGGIYFALRGQEREMVNQQTFLLCVFAWFGLPVAAAFPFVMSGQMAWVDAFFEAASGISTTGATIFPTLEGVPKAIIFWRAILQWFGGFLTLLSFLLVLAPSGVGVIRDTYSKFMEQSLGDEIGWTANVLRQVGTAYGLITLALVVLLVVVGIPPFDSTCIAFSTISTGGFLPFDGAIGEHYDNRLAEIVIALGMIAGSSSVVWHRMAVRKKLQFLVEHRESYILFALMFVVGLFYSITLFQLAGGASVLAPSAAIRQGFFAAISLISTTGFELRHADVTVFPGLLVVSLALMGATSFSTSGGLKIYRVVALFMQLVSEVSRLLHPNKIHKGRLGDARPTIQFMNGVWTSLFLTLTLIAVVTGVVTSHTGYLDGSILATVSSFANIGPLYSTSWTQTADWPSYFEMAPVVKYALAATMLLGRVEIIVLLGALSFRTWLR
nr:potassium transporter TrkG [uncultured Cohaesibacter sp.]